MTKALFVLLLSLSLVLRCSADVYMHNPRGSNDRNCERNVNRNNGNRLFDSQNNNQGGYACPRAVGNEDFQAEDGSATFSAVDPTTGDVTQFTQNKRVYYYSGSVLPIEWTNQHGCGGNSKISCEIVIQYACEDTLDPAVDDFWPWVENKAEVGTTHRGEQKYYDGTGMNVAAPRDGVPRDSNDAATDTIPDDPTSAVPDTTETRRFGMHESEAQYDLCQHTERNKGLYTADQQVRRNDQRGTRQNPQGNRRGLECPEERDYYPWWHPTPWVDIAVLTDSGANDVCYPSDTSACTTRCKYYMDNTMNFNPKGYCDTNHSDPTATVDTKLASALWQQNRFPNNKDACEKAKFAWYEVSHADNLQLADNNFVCAHTQFSRVNQLGNARADTVISQNQMQSAGVVKQAVNEGVNANRFLWTVPEIPTAPSSSYFPRGMETAYKSCALRIRYNISSADFQQWPQDAVDVGTVPMVNSSNNAKVNGKDSTPLRQDPYVFIGPGDSTSKGEMFVKLKVNTNQYGRTFQDRSYVFSIKPLPTADAAASNQQDTPAVDYTAMSAALASGGKIYNVNVRGKRGNIVQVYPSVEYDFVPNALALGVNDMVHFQWTGSDYNPRRGCNDATGGPPDANLFSTNANADNPRADRSNALLTEHMAHNVPRDYVGYNRYNATLRNMLSFAEKQDLAQTEALTSGSPCYDAATDDSTVADACFQQIKRLADLNQQSDVGSLVLRSGKNCLTTTELDAILNQDQADYHPLNCAKMNAKPYPYFDGGVMVMRKKGQYPFYSSRNNNFSNRQQIGIICVGGDCQVDNSTSVLQDTNPMTNGISTNAASQTDTSQCYDTAGGENGANANGVMSCLNNDPTLLVGDSFASQEGDNDGKGDGNAQGCATLSFSDVGSSRVESSVALAIGLLFVGVFLTWLAYYLYNRYQARRDGDSKFRYDTAWQTAGGPDGKTGRPASGTFAEINIMRTHIEMGNKADTDPVRPAPPRPNAPAPARDRSASPLKPKRTNSPPRSAQATVMAKGKSTKRYDMI